MMGKFYVVFVGRVPGIYDNWEDCDAQVFRFSGCRHQSFKTYDDAEEWKKYKATLEQGSVRRRADDYKTPEAYFVGTVRSAGGQSARGQEGVIVDSKNEGVHKCEVERVADVDQNTQQMTMNPLLGVLLGMLILYTAIRGFISSLQTDRGKFVILD